MNLLTTLSLTILLPILVSSQKSGKQKKDDKEKGKADWRRDGQESQDGTFYMKEDWPKQKFNVTDVVTFTINAPQMPSPYDKFDVRISLFGTKVPYTVGNFAQLAAGGIEVVTNDTSKAKKKENRPVLHYKNTILHRLEKGVSIQGGDVVYNNGSGSVTRYNSEAMAPENYWLSNYGKGWVGMVHNGPPYYSIGCQFYICMTNNRQILSALNLQRFVVIGKVTYGMDKLEALDNAIDNEIELIKDLVPQTGYPLNKPKVDIKITDSRYMLIKKIGRAKQENRPSSGSLYGEWPQPEKKKDKQNQ